MHCKSNKGKNLLTSHQTISKSIIFGGCWVYKSGFIISGWKAEFPKVVFYFLYERDKSLSCQSFPNLVMRTRQELRMLARVYLQGHCQATVISVGDFIIFTRGAFRGVQNPQHWIFQDATKNCGYASLGNPRTP